MAHPLELVQDAAADDWSDPVLTARQATEGLLALGSQQRAQAARMLRRARPDGPLLLAVTEAALNETSGLEMIVKALQDRTWVTELGLAVAHHASLGITSLSSNVLEVLEAAVQLGESRAELYADRRAVARGLGYLGMQVEIAPPEEAGVLMLAAVAATPQSVWTTQREADIALASAARGRRVVPVVHPLARLSPAGLADYRPASGLNEVHLA